MNKENTNNKDNVCLKCGASLGEIIETPTGKKLRRCSAGVWDPKTRKTQGCDFVKWLPIEPQVLDEKCPKCGEALVLVTTRYGKKLKRCKTAGWDKENKKATGCDYVEWIKGTTKPLDEKCPECGSQLVLYTSSSNKTLKKCSTSGWDNANKQPTGCTYVYWFKPGEQIPQ